jgi:hypothetical protein
LKRLYYLSAKRKRRMEQTNTRHTIQSRQQLVEIQEFSVYAHKLPAHMTRNVLTDPLETAEVLKIELMGRGSSDDSPGERQKTSLIRNPAPIMVFIRQIYHHIS